ncbi:phosphotransferase-like protein [Sphingomonas jatrophae]|uniref:Shikimate kinase n=1 Tax=Sphingomonas jatrophae TaxID=1166337 RepID=A0A1I6LG04_9SPHN|nr:shikimate kinase [Sphingomonas jatrophae]SFS02347.1 hypothetical protein SAMN05192580_2694 [Sphingomonas jatrophae]
MQLVFLYGQVAAGKLTVARALAARTGMALFHNHLVVDAVAAVFPFGSEPFIRLREAFWLEVIEAAARDGRSLIFTFAPEASVAADFPERVRGLVERCGGRTIFVALTLERDEQARRLVEPGRAAFGKLRDPALFATHASEFDRCMAAMPTPDLAIDSGSTSPEDAAAQIVALMER